MFSRKFILFFALVFITINIFVSFSYGQKNKVKITSKSKTFKKNFNKLIQPKKVVSFGVLNGKAISLVKPKYPLTAYFGRVKGTVNIQVLINENGDVVEAKAYHNAHPFLIPSAIEAAKASKFEPFILTSGQRLKVSGIITYNFVSDSINWFELGYFSDSIVDLHRFLPFNFDEEKILLNQANQLSQDEANKLLETVVALIEGKLSSHAKSLWLFSVGKNINFIAKNHWQAEKKQNAIETIRKSLYSNPENISPLLIKKLENLIDSKNNDKFNENLIDLTGKLYSLGL